MEKMTCMTKHVKITKADRLAHIADLKAHQPAPFTAHELRRVMKHAHVTVEELSAETGIPIRHLKDWVGGKRPVSLPMSHLLWLVIQQGYY